MLEVNRLYPQYKVRQERRQQKAPVSPVAFERRSGIDRRTDDRIKLDTTLTRDIFEVKNKVSQLQKTTQSNSEKINFTQNVSRAVQKSIKSDQFIKTAKPNTAETPKTIQKAKSDAGALAGVLAVVLGGTLASTLLGVAGVGIAIGLGAYFGGKVLRSAIVSHLKNK